MIRERRSDARRLILAEFSTDRPYSYITVAALKKACAEEGFDYRKLVSDLVEDGFFIPNVKVGKGATNCYRFRNDFEPEIKRPPEEPPEKPIEEPSEEPIKRTLEDELQDIVDETFGFKKAPYKEAFVRKPPRKPPD